MKRSPHFSVAMAAAIVCAFALHSSDVRADPTMTAAEHAKRAQAAYDVQNWPTAIQEYQAAYQGEQKSEYLWALAQTQRLSGDPATAIKTYKAFKRSENVTASQATAAELQITKCEAEIEKKQAEAATKASRPADAGPAPASSSRPEWYAPTPAPGSERPKSSGSILSSPWFWGAAGVLVVGGVTTGIVLATSGSSTAAAPAYAGNVPPSRLVVR